MRTVLIVTGLVVLLGGGVVHGVWTERWQHSTFVQDQAEKLDRLPDDLGPWKGEAVEMKADELAVTGAVGHYCRSFTDPVTGDKVQALILCGKANHLVVHRPEDCYGAAGYRMAGPAYKVLIPEEGGPPAEFFTGVFSHDEAAGPSQLRIYWSWLGSDGWAAPKNPRFAFAREKALYKLYVIRNTTGANVPAHEDPCARLIGRLLPVARRTLTDS